ncbi:ubiquitin-like small modifier protein 1 [Phytomonospora endophytica]|uniref:Molybdopterin converting factor small subunit n=1 Tax=Phytomonospora endophytica TaxID=714109 RepID=A0A841FBD3_9ACTN|nr:ubiquitin-like small modifier protein 1 [Phytomonospora endophytica]MBB6034581.1 molybdopterin converting factor small subunit [Phytomonospora endophytica]GIG71359.1 molybdopterin synthase sulfur carrier subunit [Phytomonospora endophytica]
MAVSVLIPGALRVDAAGESKVSVELGDGGVLRDVLDALAERHPRIDRRLRDERGELRRYVNVYVDGEECRRAGGLDTPVGETSEVQILPSVAGG